MKEKKVKFDEASAGARALFFVKLNLMPQAPGQSCKAYHNIKSKYIILVYKQMVCYQKIAKWSIPRHTIILIFYKKTFVSCYEVMCRSCSCSLCPISSILCSYYSLYICINIWIFCILVKSYCLCQRTSDIRSKGKIYTMSTNLPKSNTVNCY